MESNTRDVVQVNFIFNMPKDRRITNLSNLYPNLKIFILSLIPLSAPKGLVLLQVVGPNLENFLNDVAKLYPGSTHHILGKQEPQVLLSLELADPWFLNQIMAIELNIRYPIQVQAGKMQLDIIDPRKKVDMLIELYNKANLNVKLNHIGRVHLKPLLTYQQEQILMNAIKWGFNEIPRRITLHEFAKRMNMSASALSENLRRITNKLIQEYLRSNFLMNF